MYFVIFLDGHVYSYTLSFWYACVLQFRGDSAVYVGMAGVLPLTDTSLSCTIAWILHQIYCNNSAVRYNKRISLRCPFEGVGGQSHPSVVHISVHQLFVVVVGFWMKIRYNNMNILSCLTLDTSYQVCHYNSVLPY